MSGQTASGKGVARRYRRKLPRVICVASVLARITWAAGVRWMAPCHSQASCLLGGYVRTALGRPIQTRLQFFQGSVVDPTYWKQQWFLSGDLKGMMPKSSKLTVVEFLPSDNKNLAYLCPDPAKTGKLERYIAIWDTEEDDPVKVALNGQSAMYVKRDPEYANWNPDKQTMILADTADLVLLGAGTIAKLGTNTERGLRETRRVLKHDGCVLLVVDKSEEVRLGDLDYMFYAEDSIFRQVGLEMEKILRDEGSGLAIVRFTKLPTSVTNPTPPKTKSKATGKMARNRDRAKR